MAPARDQQGSLENGLKELNLTDEELNKFEKAFKDPEFLKLFEEYAKEVSDPKVKAETDQYLRQLEEQGRAEDVYGKGVQLITPTPGLVLKTKVMGPKAGPEADSGAASAPATGAGGKRDSLPTGQKVFINVCTSDKVERYSLKEAQDASGRTGKQLSIPITTGPVRQGTDKQGQPAAVYDVVVHPETIEFAARSAPVMSTLAEMALEQVETVSRSRLFRGWRRLSSRYKATEGCAEPPVMCVRTGEGGESVGGRLRPRAEMPGVDLHGAKPAPAAAAAAPADGSGGPAKAQAATSRSTFSFNKAKGRVAGQQQQQEPVKEPSLAGYRHPDGSVTPEWVLVHRGQADLSAAWGDAGRGLALDSMLPKELLLRAVLPEVTSAAGVDLDVGERRLTLKVPGKYHLDVVLPYAVDGDKGKAKLDKARKQLEIVLPVVPPPPPPQPPVAAEAAAVQELPAREAAEEPEATAEAAKAEMATAEAATVEAATARSGVLGPKVAGAKTGVEGEAEGAEAARARDAAVSTSSDDPREARAKGAEAAGTGQQQGEVDRPPSSTATTMATTPTMTENERKWRELYQHRTPAGAGCEAVASREEGGEGAAALSPSSCAAAGAELAGGAGAASRPAVAAESEPTVLLKPRLRCDLAMELD